MAFRSRSLPRRPLPRETIDAAGPAHLYVETGLATPKSVPHSVPMSAPHAVPQTLPPLHSTMSDGGRYGVGASRKPIAAVGGRRDEREWLMKGQTPKQPRQHLFHTPRVIGGAAGPIGVGLAPCPSDESRNPLSEVRGRSILRTERRYQEDVHTRGSREGAPEGRDDDVQNYERRVQLGRGQPLPYANDMTLGAHAGHRYEQGDLRAIEHSQRLQHRHMHREQDLSSLHSLHSLQHEERRRHVEHYKIFEKSKFLEQEVAAKDAELREAKRQLWAMAEKGKEASKKGEEIADLKRQLQNAERVSDKMMAAQKAQLANAHAKALVEVQREYKAALVEAVAENEALQDKVAEARMQMEHVDDLRRAAEDAELHQRMLDEVTRALEGAIAAKDEAELRNNVLKKEGALWRDAKEKALRSTEEALAEKNALQTAKASLERALEEARGATEDVATMATQSEEMVEAMERCQTELEKLREDNAGLAAERDNLKEELICVLEQASEYQGDGAF